MLVRLQLSIIVLNYAHSFLIDKNSENHHKKLNNLNRIFDVFFFINIKYMVQRGDYMENMDLSSNKIFSVARKS